MGVESCRAIQLSWQVRSRPIGFDSACLTNHRESTQRKALFDPLPNPPPARGRELYDGSQATYRRFATLLSRPALKIFTRRAMPTWMAIAGCRVSGLMLSRWSSQSIAAITA